MKRLTRKTTLHFAVMASVLCLGLLLAGCKEPPPPTPTREGKAVAVGAPVTAPPDVVLQIVGVDEAGLPVTLQIASTKTRLCFVLDESCWASVLATSEGPAYLEYALVGQAGPVWRLYHAEAPTGIATPAQVQVHAVQSVDGAVSLFKSGPTFSIASSVAISPTAASGTHIEIKEGIRLINRMIGSDPPVGYVLAGPTSFLLLSNGDTQAPTYSLIILSSVQPDGTLDPPPPGSDTDPKTYCQTCFKCAWWCWIASLFG